MAKAHLFKPGEAMTAETMNTLLQGNQIIFNYDESADIPEDYILSAKGVKEKLKRKYTVNAQEITAQGLADNAVTTQKIADNSVTESKIADNANTEIK